jgi:SAM-dependent methyltransferase
MQRVCEPELMDDPPQARAYAEADFASTDQAFTDRILALLTAHDPAWLALAAPHHPEGPGLPPANRRILDLGCGPGNISFRLAAALPGASVLGIDGAAAMLELAERRLALAPPLGPGLRFARACLPLPAGVLEGQPPSFAPPYALIVSNSLLHHLHDPAVLWRAVRQWAPPGALVVMRDLRRPASPDALQALVERHAGSAPAVLRRDSAASLAAAFRPEEVAAQLAENGLGVLRVEPLDDRCLEISGRLPA